MRRLPGFILAFSSILLAAQAAPAQQYTVTDLGALYYTNGFSDSHATAIDNWGDVTGNSIFANSSPYVFLSHAFLYSEGRMTDLGTLPGHAQSSGLAVNRVTPEKNRALWHGAPTPKVEVTGYATNDASDYAINPEAFLYANGGMLDIGALSGGSISAGTGVNQHGQVVGYSYSSGPTKDEHFFLYNNGKMQDLGFGAASAINDSGQITGSTGSAFLYSNGQIKDLGALPGSIKPFGSFGTAINNAGQVTGTSSSNLSSQYNATQQAFLYTNGRMLPVPPVPNLGPIIWDLGEGINRWGEIVGYASGAFNPFNYPTHGFIYRGGHSLDLNNLIAPNSGWIIIDAPSINDKGQIAATGLTTTSAGPVFHALRLDPVCNNARRIRDGDGEGGWQDFGDGGQGNSCSLYRQADNGQQSDQ